MEGARQFVEDNVDTKEYQETIQAEGYIKKQLEDKWVEVVRVPATDTSYDQALDQERKYIK